MWHKKLAPKRLLHRTLPCDNGNLGLLCVRVLVGVCTHKLSQVVGASLPLHSLLHLEHAALLLQPSSIVWDDLDSHSLTACRGAQATSSLPSCKSLATAAGQSCVIQLLCGMDCSALGPSRCDYPYHEWALNNIAR